MRDKIKEHVKSLGVQECDTWSGQEFEEFLRKDAESLLKRFVEGEPFPDAPEDLRKLAESTQPLNDDEVLAAFVRKVFDRPAFYTPIHQESNLGDFKQAITDTIQALGTGIWKARDGHVIDRIPSRHQLKSDALAHEDSVRREGALPPAGKIRRDDQIRCSAPLPVQQPELFGLLFQSL